MRNEGCEARRAYQPRAHSDSQRSAGWSDSAEGAQRAPIHWAACVISGEDVNKNGGNVIDTRLSAATQRPDSPSVAIIGTRGYPSYYGGFETAVRKLAPALVKAGWDVSVYSREGATRNDDPDRDPEVHVRYTRGVNSRSLSTVTYGLTSMFDAARRKPDAALIMNVANCLWIPLLRWRRVPTLVNVDGIEWERAKWGRVARTVFRIGARFTAWWADELVFDAAAIGERWQREFNRSGVTIPYGGDLVEAADVPLGLPSRGYVLVVARFVPENSIPAFFRAAAELADRVPVVIVGSDGHGGDLDAQAQALDDSHEDVHWLGHVSNDELLHALWVHAGAYFHGHTVGGTNPALVQAMACGAPTVAVDTVFNREVLDTAGIFVAPEPEEIAQAILALISDPGEQQRLADEARTRASTDYSWDTVNGQYEKALKALVVRPPVTYASSGIA